MKQTLTLILLLSFHIISAQQFRQSDVPAGMRNTTPLTKADADIFSTIEELKLPDEYRSRDLPDSIDNSVHDWFRRPIFAQTSYPNCMQSTSIAYNFTYEINRLRNVSGSDPDHQYTTHFAWNFFNGGNGWYGVNYLFTMDVLERHGTPNITDYGGFYAGGGSRWMSGYDEWYNAMNNRISGIKKIYVGNEEGILTLKHWLVNHLDGSESGGLASFISCSPWDMTTLPPESPQAGKRVIVYWCPEALHGMTIVGYNDSIRYDYNEDGNFTNHIDINHDGVLDVKDWEIGAVKFCNSYGEDWADSGFCYMMYKALADDFGEGGIWTNTVHVLEAKPEHNTRMTYKVSLEHDFRERIRVQAGISSNLNSNKPEYILSFNIFNYQGGWHYMQGIDSLTEYKTIEFGLDVSSLLSIVEPGQPYKFFLIVDEKDPENLGYGQVKNFSLIDYQNGINEVPCDEQFVPLVENGRTMLSIIHEPTSNDLSILTENLPLYTPGQELEVQLEASGGEEDYSWHLDRNYEVNKTEGDFPEINENKIIENSWIDSLATVVLDFEFPFYGNVFDTLVVSSSGYLYFDENMYFWSYIVDNDYFLKNSRAIAPLLCQDMFVYSGNEHGVWYEGDASKATFRWRTAIYDDEETSELNFAACLYPDGKIEFYYDEMVLEEPIRHTAGISDGDFYNNSIPELPDPPNIRPGTMVELYLPKQPETISLSKNGFLKIFESDESTLSEIGVVVTDNTLLSARRSYLLTDGLEISLNMQGSSDLSISNGQIASIDLNIVNRGNTAYDNLQLSLGCNNTLLEIIDGLETISSIGPGEDLQITDAFSCFCDQSMPDDQKMILDLDATGSGISYERECTMISLAPALELGGYRVLNDIDLLEPDETEDIQIRLVNSGSRKSINTVATLSCSHEGISINTEQPLNLGTIGSWEDVSFDVSISANYSIAFGTEVDFVLELIDEIGLETQTSFSMRIGRTPIYIVDMDLVSGSGAHLRSVFDDMDIEYDYIAAFPQTINNYQSVFLCLGKQFTNHVLNWQQSEMLTEYLDKGGKLYMEGRMVWEQDPSVPILNRFNVDTETGPGMYEVLDGVDNTFTQGLSYANDAQQPFCFFYLIPEAPAYSIFTGREYPNCAAVAYDEGSYKTIASIFELGYLVSSDTCQVDSLMQGILEFFDIKQGVTGIEEIPAGESVQTLQNYPNPFRDRTYIPIKIEERSQIDAGIYDLQGRRIYDLLTGSMLEPGTYRLDWDAKDEGGNPVPDGIYFYRILIDGTTYTGKMVLIR